MQFWSSEHRPRVLGCKDIAMEKHNKKQETSLKPSSSYFHLAGKKLNLTSLWFSGLDRNQAIETIFAGRRRGEKKKAGKFDLNLPFSFLGLNISVLLISCHSDACCECQILPQARADRFSFTLSLTKRRNKSMSKPYNSFPQTL